MKKISLSEVANSLGVSKTLVSFVINGKAKEKGISDATVKKVVEKIKELDYKPNIAARTLRTGISKTIGIIVADISNPFYARICKNIESQVSKQGYNVVFSSTNENWKKEKDIIQLMDQRGIDGIILSPSRPYSIEIENEFNSISAPIVFIDRHYKQSKINYIAADNYNAAYESTSYLLSKGHTRIGFAAIKPTTTTVMTDRLSGYKKALTDNGIEFSNDLYSEFSLEDLSKPIYEKIDCLNSNKLNVTAFIFANNKITMAFLECFKKRNIKIPDEISILSFDYLDVFKILSPPISSIQLYAETIGDKAAELILNKIYRKKDNFENVIIESKFHERESVKDLNLEYKY